MALVAIYLCGFLSQTVFGENDTKSNDGDNDTDDAFVPFVIPAVLAKDSPIAWPSARPIAPDSPRVRVKDGHFVIGEGDKAERFRVWGVNVCFLSSMPTHAEAERTAGRLAWLGVNSVRIHSMDTYNYPAGIWDPQRPGQFHPEALDRLDYFVDQLAKNGIHVNLNLHVGRTHSLHLKLPDIPGNHYDNMVDLFTPQLIDAQKDYAKRLLTRENKYRKTRYADDAAIAFVEISNENSLFLWGWREKLPKLPPFYANILQEKFVAWLKDRHGTTDQLRDAWAKGATPLGENMLPALTEPDPKGGPGVWSLKTHDKCDATVKATKENGGSVRITPTVTDAIGWHLEYVADGLTFAEGQFCTVSFRVRSDKPRTVAFSLSQAHEPWGGLGVWEAVSVTEQWQEVRRSFIAPKEENGRLSFGFGGGDKTPFEIADVQLRPGGEVGLAESETLEAGNIAVFPAASAPSRQHETVLFLVETEKAFWDGMYAYIKDELKCGALVTGTSVYGPGNLYAQSDMDYIDGHAYWQHPEFPGRAWDGSDWRIRQLAMVDHPDQATLPQLAAQRLAGKPFTVSEYNHPAPLDSQAECVPMLAAFAAAQDWDGVWFFTYAHHGDEIPAFFDNYFDIKSNPAKLGFLPAGAAMFRQGLVGPMPEEIVSFTEKDGGAVMARLQASCDTMQSAVKRVSPRSTPLWTRQGRNLSVTFNGPSQYLKVEMTTLCTLLSWQVEQGKGLFALTALGGYEHSGTVAYVGRPVAPEEKFDTSGEHMVRLVSPKFAAVTITPLDGKRLGESTKLLITACGRCENTDMIFNGDRTSVGTNWGKGPVRIEPVTAQIALPGTGWTCHALNSDGSLGEKVPVLAPRAENDKTERIEISPAYKTMWYVLTR